MPTVVFFAECFDISTCGRKTIVRTDHKPLPTVAQKPFNSAPKRLLKMLIRLQNGYRRKFFSIICPLDFELLSMID